MSKRSFWRPRILEKVKDGGPESPVTAYFLFEWKPLASVCLLHFPQGSRENFHGHAFNSAACVLWGRLEEEDLYSRGCQIRTPGQWFCVYRDTIHRVWGRAKSSWVLNLRGPWRRTWQEVTPTGQVINLSHGRVVQ